MWTLALLAGIVFFSIRSRRSYQALPELPASGSPAPADLTVIIPARNEERNIARVVRSLVGVPVIVVDDHSEDRTADEARQAGALVIPAPPLPRGALGKSHACQAGAVAAQTRWILFVDADTCYEPAFLASLLSYAQANHLAAASAFLRQVRITLPEKILMPYAFALYFCGADPTRAPASVANGQCFLFRRDVYEAIGGHRAVLDSVIEDVALAGLMHRQGYPAQLLRAEHLGSVRMYDSFAAIARGFQKNSFRFLLADPTSGVQVILASILFTSYLPALAWLLANGHLCFGVAFALLPGIVLAPWYGSFEALVFAPVAIYLFQAIALYGMFTTLFRRKAIWKGRHV